MTFHHCITLNFGFKVGASEDFACGAEKHERPQRVKQHVEVRIPLQRPGTMMRYDQIPHKSACDDNSIFFRTPISNSYTVRFPSCCHNCNHSFDCKASAIGGGAPDIGIIDLSTVAFGARPFFATSFALSRGTRTRSNHS